MASRPWQLEEISNVLDGQAMIPIACNPWPEFGHEVKAGFSMAHCREAILLKYYVEESYLLAAATANGEVHKDSCVEFFVAFDGDEHYYNLEFNCIGWYKAGYGSFRENRDTLPAEVTDRIQTATNIRSSVQNGARRFYWELTMVLPLEVFCFHEIQGLSDLKVRGNFHKCGDELPTPHFLTWNHVRAEEPDFHRVEDFADILFL